MKNEECVLLSSVRDGYLPSEFTASHHIHIWVHRGMMRFSDGKQNHLAAKDDLVIWQMSNSIGKVEYSDDFECDFLAVAPHFLVHFNPEMIWAARGYVFIRLNPVYHLDGEDKVMIEDDFRLFKERQGREDNPFRRELLGRVLQIFLYDLWHIYRDGVASMTATDRAAQLFFRFLTLAQENVLADRSVAYYADRLCITTKYLTQVCRSVSGLSAMQWIEYYTSFELVSRLDDGSRTLADIADEMGFSTIQFFSRYVKKITGFSPSEYRRSKGL